MLLRLRNRLQELGKTQKWLASELSVSTVLVSKWINEHVTIQTQHIKPLARALKMEPAEVFEEAASTTVRQRDDDSEPPPSASPPPPV